MLDAMAASPEVPPRSGVERSVDAFPGREDLFDGAVADGMNADLQACGVPTLEERP